MSLALTVALTRRRALQRERERLAEMRDNAAALLGAQADVVARLEARAPTSRDIARRIEQRAKADLLNPQHGARA
ncbi:hypothetical protein [Aromatoleum aromaticum]|uniref:hypothetical protein n=1 Tax=Aromatoleum aromaticum TaxID=551760 RepID=UPI0014595223|nr:hypothetical protein [Aromatoleum aromaticum]NMG56196.1 hypothetical protein [Aromatoleum aromaticum]